MVPPIPIPSVSKSLLPGGKQIRKTSVWWFSMDFMKKGKNISCQWAYKLKKDVSDDFLSYVFSKGGVGCQWKITKTTSAIFPRVQKKEIHQWRQARSRPGEKETLNIMLGEKGWNSHVRLAAPLAPITALLTILAAAPPPAQNCKKQRSVIKVTSPMKPSGLGVFIP